MIKERLILLYKLCQIDKELSELYSLRGDLPARIEELKSEIDTLNTRSNEINSELNIILQAEKEKSRENDLLLEKIEKNDELLRTGKVKTNKEYDAIALEIQEAKTKISENEKFLENEYSEKKTSLENELSVINEQLKELNEELEQNLAELSELTKQTEEEENELQKKREELVLKINSEDLDNYEMINKVKFGEAVAIVRKGSCLGCYSSVPPQKAIEIRMAEKFYSCESCGRILISEELINDSNS
ncbi:MAG: C4-type zinc ribbon domain-containing protein [Ignavibacteria bacterium]|nr:C4-type zinc ribbon domain-containing protein [Ignavibacteria bacterium]